MATDEKHARTFSERMLSLRQKQHNKNTCDHVPDAVEGEDHAQCKRCMAWLFLNCSGHWQQLHE